MRVHVQRHGCAVAQGEARLVEAMLEQRGHILGTEGEAAALPGVRSARQRSGSERAALDRDEMRFAWPDGSLARSERLLEHLRERRGLSREEAQRIEVEVARA